MTEQTFYSSAIFEPPFFHKGSELTSIDIEKAYQNVLAGAYLRLPASRPQAAEVIHVSTHKRTIENATGYTVVVRNGSNDQVATVQLCVTPEKATIDGHTISATYEDKGVDTALFQLLTIICHYHGSTEMVNAIQDRIFLKSEIQTI
jgi:hypothetical protein